MYMSGIISLFSGVYVICILAVILKVISRVNQNTPRRGEERQKPSGVRVIERPVKSSGKNKQGGVAREVKDKGSIRNAGKAVASMEDRNNDWLAKQMREEQRILMRGDMLDLGASHAANCEAGEIKNGHLRRHGRF